MVESSPRCLQQVDSADFRTATTPLVRLGGRVTTETDASDYGLGTVLLQAGRPVAFASHTMTETERRYSQMEKECLTLVFGCTRLYIMIFKQEALSPVGDLQRGLNPK